MNVECKQAIMHY